jgi:hypothetical protein
MSGLSGASGPVSVLTWGGSCNCVPLPISVMEALAHRVVAPRSATRRQRSGAFVAEQRCETHGSASIVIHTMIIGSA